MLILPKFKFGYFFIMSYFFNDSKLFHAKNKQSDSQAIELDLAEVLKIILFLSIAGRDARRLESFYD
jgi:hypothetical protein